VSIDIEMSATREEPEWPDHSWLWDNQEHADITVVLVDRGKSTATEPSSSRITTPEECFNKLLSMQTLAESMLAWRKKSESPSKEQTRAAKKARTDELNVSEAASTMQVGDCKVCMQQSVSQPWLSLRLGLH
jgi:hypothetical protein